MAGERILVVDDAAEAREFLVEYVLKPNGYIPLVAADGEAGLRCALEEQPDLIILDMQMPRMTGLEVLEALHARGVEVPVILTTFHGSEELAIRALRLGVRDYVAKPYEAKEMLAAIERALREHRLRVERDRLVASLRQRVHEQRTLSTVGRAISSSLDLDQVLVRLTEAAVFLTLADEGWLSLVEEEELRVRAVRPIGTRHAHLVDELERDAVAIRVVERGEAVRVGGKRGIAVLGVPMFSGERIIGVLGVRRKGGGFSEEALYNLSALAGYATIAVENARLYRQLQQELEMRTIVERLNGLLTSTLNLQAILDALLDEVVRVTGAERGCVLLRREDAELELRASYQPDGEKGEFSYSRTVVNRVLVQGEAVLTDNAREDPRFSGADSVVGYQLRSILCVPIPGMRGPIGVIYLDHRRREGLFPKQHVDLLRTLAHQAAAAIQNARLFGQVEAERRTLEAVIRGIPQPVIVTSGEGMVLLMNEAARRALRVQSRGATGFLLPQVVEHEPLRALFEEARRVNCERRAEITLPNGRIYHAEVIPIAGVGCVAVLQDITELKELDQMKSEFVATVSHDIRSPLNTVLNAVTLLPQAGPLNEQQEEFVHIAQHGIRRLMHLTSRLLDLGRLEAGAPLEMTRCDWGEIVDRVVQILRPRASEQGLTLHWERPAGEVPVLGDPVLLEQVVDNLVSNAIKYTPTGGEMWVLLSILQDEARLCVRDTGVGIPEADQPFIFDRFYRVRDGRAKEVEGSGLGLAIVKSAVERHGGRVWLESELQVGSSFWVSLPLFRGSGERERT